MGISKEKAKEEIKRIIDDFKANYRQHREELEANTETKLVEPLFAALGWTKDDFVKREKTYRGKKAGFADYAFKIGDKTVFFLEVKRLGVSLEKEADKQVISYALSKRIPFAISTNFEELNIFCVEQENALHNKFRVFKSPDDYINNFDDFFFLSKDSFEQNLILTKAEAEGRLKRRASIDRKLLEDLMLIRKLISNDIERRHPDKYQINEKDEIVQRILDRLIFIRRCEDKGMNPSEIMIEEIKHLPHNKCYPRLKEIFAKYNEVYNSGLFMPNKDNDCDTINIDGEIIQKLAYYLYESKDGEYIYDFDWIDADVLGQIYEQYLGIILAQTKSGKSKLKDGQAHRKEQGIYYTPIYIVDYIVKNTLGELLKDKKVKPSEIKILDPACGSGSFLIKAFDYLAEKMGATEEAKQQKIDSQGNYSVKTQILKNNIYGVDLDNKAVEITKLNLLLKAAEKNRKLPEELDLHIRHGNSLIDDEAIAGLTAFKWSGDFAEGSFDVVIGNPPYFLMQPQNTDEKMLNYFKEKFKVAQYKIDTYHLFFEKGICNLREGGLFGFITPNTYFLNIYLSNLRKYILDNCKILKVVVIPKEVFIDASVDTAILILQKESNEKERKNNKIEVLELKDFSQGIIIKQEIIQKNFYETTDCVFNVKIDAKDNNLIQKINRNTISLGSISRVSFGLQTKDKKTYVKNKSETKEWKPCIDGGDIKRYNLKFGSQYFLHDLKIKAGGCWDESTHNVSEKIVIRQIGVTPIATLDLNKFYCLNTIYNITSLKKEFNYRYLLALINSKVLRFFWKSSFYDSKILFPKIKKTYLDQLPIKLITESQQQPFVQLVDRMLSLNKKLNEFGDKNTSETAKLKAEIEKTDAEIDNLVYTLYGISAEEKKIIEDSLK